MRPWQPFLNQWTLEPIPVQGEADAGGVLVPHGFADAPWGAVLSRPGSLGRGGPSARPGPPALRKRLAGSGTGVASGGPSVCAENTDATARSFRAS